jgi:hypothetical protein
VTILFAATPSAFAQRGGGGGHAGFGGGHLGGGAFGGGHMMGGAHMSGPPMIRGGVGRPMPMGPMMGSRGIVSVRGAVGTAGVVRGGTFAHGDPFVHGGTFVHGNFTHGFQVAPVHFFHPYYAFRPRFSLGFGIWAGYPFAYYDPFYYPYSYPYYSAYYPYGYVNLSGDPASGAYPTTPEAVESGSAVTQPSQTNTGGMSFDITPATAQLFVDGTLVGNVNQFTPTTQPLGLAAGRHHVEVRASGYQSMSFDVDIVAGEVIPYQGSLERQ